MSSLITLTDCIKRFNSITSKPEDFLSVQDDLLDDTKKLTKVLYDFTLKEENCSELKNSLPELIVEDFDDEQIWQEIELKNEEKWTSTLSSVSKLLNNKDKLTLPVQIQNVDQEIETEEEPEYEEQEEDEFQETDLKPKTPKQPKKSIDKATGKQKGSVVDDQFFKLSEMEAFLDSEDKAELMKDKKSKRKKNKKGSDQEDDEDEDEDIDLFEGWESEDEDDENGNVKYDEFFDCAPEDSNASETETSKSKSKGDFEDESEEEQDEDEYANSDDSEINLNDVDTKKGKRVSFNVPQPSSDESDDENISDTDRNEKQPERNNESLGELSEFQLRQQRLKKKIGHLEDNMLMEKSWPMKGEISADNRPQNSLLEEVVEFDVISRPAPIITEETTLKLQDIIIQRIKDKTWDDVERKMKPVQDVHEYKKQIVLDQEKSKLSLAQVYEQEYLKQKEALRPDADEKPEEEPEAHVQIRKSLNRLFAKLDALCNFHYTPKVAAPEVKIVSNIPAITMEEVAPVATSDATLLAPHEIKGKTKGDIIGKSERTKTDKKRERRQKKVHQREREKEKEKRNKVVDKLRPGLGNKYSKEKLNKLLDKVSKERNVDKMVETSDKKSLTSSTAFFTRLQEEVSDSIKSKIKSSEKKNKKQFSAKKYKL